MSSCGHLVDSTLKFKWAQGEKLGVGCPLASEIPKCGAKLGLSEGRKQQLDGFQAVVKPHQVRVPQEKNVNVGP